MYYIINWIMILGRGNEFMNTQAAIEAAKIAAETAARNAWITTIVTVIALFITSGISIWSVMRNSKITKELGEENLKSLKQKRYIDAISAERVKWINTMRDRFSEYNKIVYMQMTEFSRWKANGFTASDEEVRVEIRDRLVEIRYNRDQIRLLLNLAEPISKEIIKLQRKFSKVLGSKDNVSEFNFKYYLDLMGDLDYLHHVVLRAEWKRIKEENKTGEEIDDDAMNRIYISVAKKLDKGRYNKYLSQSKET